MQQPATSKELYMMNGGQKMYIGRDGFADVYSATPAEEAEWAREIVDEALIKVATSEDRTVLNFAIENLVFHKYDGLENLLLKYIHSTSPTRQIVFASKLWNMPNFEKSFEVIFDILKEHKAQCLDDVFVGLNNCKNHVASKHYLIYCLEGNDAQLFQKAQNTLSIWAWSGMPELRENKLLETLQFENKDLPTFGPAMNRLKQILNILN